MPKWSDTKTFEELGVLCEVRDSDTFDLQKSIQEFKTFPYKLKPYSQRNWGHSLHFLCSYQSKLKPSLAHYLVKLYTKKGDVVLDPFSGVGTIPFEACLAGRKGIGLDINPVAYHNTRAKVNPPTLFDALQQVSKLDKYIKETRLRAEISNTSDNFIKRFYHEDTLTEILKAKQYFYDRRDKDGKLSLMIACILHVLHGNRPYALSRRSHGLTPLAPSGRFQYKSLIKSLGDKVRRSLSDEIPKEFVRGEAYQGSVLKLPVESESVDSIISSPPFLNSTRFFANNRVRLWFCGWEYQEQNERRKGFLDEQQKKDVRVYNDVFDELNRVLRRGGLCVLHIGVIGNVDMVKLLIPMAESRGFKKLDITYEDASNLESHGMTDQGVTRLHAVALLRKY